MQYSATSRRKLIGPFGVSALLHVLLGAALFIVARPNETVALPPIYKVDIVAAPPGPRAIGEVKNSDPSKSNTTADKVREIAPKEAVAPTKTSNVPPPSKATPVPTKGKSSNKPLPKAGGGPVGGKGSDVATVRTEGIDFPYPGYLNNIVRQIALNFNPPNPNAPLKADVMFLIHRNGSVSGLRFITRSGNYAFDLESQGAIEAAAAANAFGPLPDGFPDDVLPIVFAFDPRFIK